LANLDTDNNVRATLTPERNKLVGKNEGRKTAETKKENLKRQKKEPGAQERLQPSCAAGDENGKTCARGVGAGYKDISGQIFFTRKRWNKGGKKGKSKTWLSSKG